MPLPVLPDAELLITQFLHQQQDVIDAIEQRVYTEVPSRATYPLGKVHRIGGIPTIRQHFDHPRIQVEAWADTKREAHDVGRILQAALHAMPESVHALGVVTGVDDDLGLIWLPDPVSKKPRYIFGIVAHIHPHPQ